MKRTVHPFHLEPGDRLQDGTGREVKYVNGPTFQNVIHITYVGGDKDVFGVKAPKMEVERS